MKTWFLNMFVLLFAMLLFSSCKKEFDTPPVKSAADANKINIANIKAKYFSNINYKFKGDSSLYCVVTADEVSGNLYKDIYVKDVTGALHVKFIASGGFFIGDSIRINLQGAILNEYNKLIQLDSVDSEKNIVKLASGFKPTPVPLTISQINAAANSAINSVQSKLVKIDNVEFLEADRNAVYADADGKASLNRVIRSCDGQTLTVRTSGYSSFASKTTPSGNGSVIGIASQFGTTMQLLLRSNEEVSMNGNLCSGTPTTPPTGNSLMTKDFNDGSLTSGGWSTQAVTSSISWSVSSTGVTSPASGNYAKITNFPSNAACELWLISPAINLSAANNPDLTFVNAYNFGPKPPTPLVVCVSTNYNGGSPSSATWTSLTVPTISSGNYLFVNSGSISLSAYKSANTRIAFKYATTGSSSTWEIDNIEVKEN